MTLPDTPVARFIRSLTLQNSTSETTASASHFADVFMAVNPQGAQCVRADDLALALPKRKQLFESHGHRSTTLLSVHEIALDASHVLAQTQWRFIFDRTPGDPLEIDTESTFIVQTSVKSMKILFYLNSQDPLALLQQQTALLAQQPVVEVKIPEKPSLRG